MVRGRTLATWSLGYLHTSAGTDGIATATITLSRGDETYTDAATGDGPVNAAFSALDRICGTTGELQDYQLRSVTKGRDAQGEVSLRVTFADDLVGGKGLSTDVVHASVIAYLDAVNRHSYQQSHRGTRDGDLAREAKP